MHPLLKEPARAIWRRAIKTKFGKLVPGYAEVERAIQGYLEADRGTKRAEHLVWAFTRAESPYTRAVIRAGGLMKAAELVTGLDREDPLMGKLADKFATPEHPVPTLGSVVRGMASLLSILQISHPKLWIDVGTQDPTDAFDPSEFDPAIIFPPEAIEQPREKESS
jgi:hypothetical protein